EQGVVERRRRRPAPAAGEIHARGERARPRGQPRRGGPTSLRRPALHRARHAARARARRGSAPHRRVDRREALPVVARRPLGDVLRRSPAGACAAVGGPVHAHRHRAWAQRTRGGGRRMIGLARLGGPVACLGLALLLLSTSRRDRLAGLGFAVLGACMIAASLAPNDYWEAVGGTFAALAVAALLAACFRRVPWLLPMLALACIPVRVGALGHHQLLVPLYVVVLGAALQLAWELVHGDLQPRELRAAAWPLALYVAWVGLSLGWTQDVHEGAVEVLAFYVPFTVLAVAVARLPWKRFGVWALYAELTAMALVFAGVGF